MHLSKYMSSWPLQYHITTCDICNLWCQKVLQAAALKLYNHLWYHQSMVFQSCNGGPGASADILWYIKIIIFAYIMASSRWTGARMGPSNGCWATMTIMIAASVATSSWKFKLDVTVSLSWYLYRRTKAIIIFEIIWSWRKAYQWLQIQVHSTVTTVPLYYHIDGGRFGCAIVVYSARK